MKKLKLTLILMIAIILNCSAQWTKVAAFNLGFKNYAHSVFFTSIDTGYVVASSGQILKTTDGGPNWTNLVSNTNESLNDVFFLSGNIGYIVGGNGTILKTENAGTTWTPCLSSTTNELWSVCFTNSNTGYAAGDSIYKTSDGGINWTEIGLEKQVHGIYFYNENIGYAFACDSGIIFKTINAGVNWTKNYSDIEQNEFIESVYFTSIDTGFAVSANGYILKTTNGGTSWSKQITNHWLSSVFFINSNTGYVAGGNFSILKTNNSSTTWVTQYEDSTEDEGFEKIFFVNSNVGYALADTSIFKISNASGVDNISNNNSVTNIYPNPATNNLTIECQQKSTVEIINIQGQTILQRLLQQDKTDIDINGLSKGVYILRLNNNKETQVTKFLKE